MADWVKPGVFTSVYYPLVIRSNGHDGLLSKGNTRSCCVPGQFILANHHYFFHCTMFPKMVIPGAKVGNCLFLHMDIWGFR